MEKTFNYVGIDISKLTFDVSKNQKGKYIHYKFSNDVQGFKSFLKLLDGNDCCVMEASGPYYLKLAFYLSDNNIAVSVVNPLVIKRFSQMRLLRTKTDKKDSFTITAYAETEKPALWEPVAPYILELKQMHAYSDQLNKSKAVFERQLESFGSNPIMSDIVSTSCNNQIESISKELKMIEKEMIRIITENHGEQYKQLKSIPGIGPKTAMFLIVISGGFSKFDKAKELCSFVGLAPGIFESGTSIKKKARICKMGMGKIRAMLYVCAWSAKKKNKACRELFERLLEKGKAKKLALIAVANKLLKQAFAIAKYNKYYNENILNISCI